MLSVLLVATAFAPGFNADDSSTWEENPDMAKMAIQSGEISPGSYNEVPNDVWAQMDNFDNIDLTMVPDNAWTHINQQRIPPNKVGEIPPKHFKPSQIDSNYLKLHSLPKQWIEVKNFDNVDVASIPLSSWEAGVIDQKLIKGEKVSEIPKEHFDPKAVEKENLKYATWPQILNKVENFNDLRDTDPEQLREAFKNYGSDVDVSGSSNPVYCFKDDSGALRLQGEFGELYPHQFPKESYQISVNKNKVEIKKLGEEDKENIVSIEGADSIVYNGDTLELTPKKSGTLNIVGKQLSEIKVGEKILRVGSDSASGTISLKDGVLAGTNAIFSTSDEDKKIFLQGDFLYHPETGSLKLKKGTFEIYPIENELASEKPALIVTASKGPIAIHPSDVQLPRGFSDLSELKYGRNFGKDYIYMQGKGKFKVGELHVVNHDIDAKFSRKHDAIIANGLVEFEDSDWKYKSKSKNMNFMKQISRNGKEHVVANAGVGTSSNEVLAEISRKVNIGDVIGGGIGFITSEEGFELTGIIESKDGRITYSVDKKTLASLSEINDRNKIILIGTSIVMDLMKNDEPHASVIVNKDLGIAYEREGGSITYVLGSAKVDFFMGGTLPNVAEEMKKLDAEIAKAKVEGNNPTELIKKKHSFEFAINDHHVRKNIESGNFRSAIIRTSNFLNEHEGSPIENDVVMYLGELHGKSAIWNEVKLREQEQLPLKSRNEKYIAELKSEAIASYKKAINKYSSVGDAYEIQLEVANLRTRVASISSNGDDSELAINAYKSLLEHVDVKDDKEKIVAVRFGLAAAHMNVVENRNAELTSMTKAYQKEIRDAEGISTKNTKAELTEKSKEWYEKKIKEYHKQYQNARNNVIEEYSKIIDMEGVDKNTKSMAHLGLSGTYVSDQNFEGALGSLGHALEADPDNQAAKQLQLRLQESILRGMATKIQVEQDSITGKFKSKIGMKNYDKDSAADYAKQVFLNTGNVFSTLWGRPQQLAEEHNNLIEKYGRERAGIMLLQSAVKQGIPVQEFYSIYNEKDKEFVETVSIKDMSKVGYQPASIGKLKELVGKVLRTSDENTISMFTASVHAALSNHDVRYVAKNGRFDSFDRAMIKAEQRDTKLGFWGLYLDTPEYGNLVADSTLRLTNGKNYLDQGSLEYGITDMIYQEANLKNFIMLTLPAAKVGELSLAGHALKTIGTAGKAAIGTERVAKIAKVGAGLKESMTSSKIIGQLGRQLIKEGTLRSKIASFTARMIATEGAEEVVHGGVGWTMDKVGAGGQARMAVHYATEFLVGYGGLFDDAFDTIKGTVRMASNTQAARRLLISNGDVVGESVGTVANPAARKTMMEAIESRAKTKGYSFTDAGDGAFELRRSVNGEVESRLFRVGIEGEPQVSGVRGMDVTTQEVDVQQVRRDTEQRFEHARMVSSGDAVSPVVIRDTPMLSGADSSKTFDIPLKSGKTVTIEPGSDIANLRALVKSTQTGTEIPGSVKFEVDGTTIREMGYELPNKGDVVVFKGTDGYMTSADTTVAIDLDLFDNAKRDVIVDFYTDMIDMKRTFGFETHFADLPSSQQTEVLQVISKASKVETTKGLDFNLDGDGHTIFLTEAAKGMEGSIAVRMNGFRRNLLDTESGMSRIDLSKTLQRNVPEFSGMTPMDKMRIVEEVAEGVSSKASATTKSTLRGTASTSFELHTHPGSTFDTGDYVLDGVLEKLTRDNPFNTRGLRANQAHIKKITSDELLKSSIENSIDTRKTTRRLNLESADKIRSNPDLYFVHLRKQEAANLVADTQDKLRTLARNAESNGVDLAGFDDVTGNKLVTPESRLRVAVDNKMLDVGQQSGITRQLGSEVKKLDDTLQSAVKQLELDGFSFRKGMTPEEALVDVANGKVGFDRKKMQQGARKYADGLQDSTKIDDLAIARRKKLLNIIEQDNPDPREFYRAALFDHAFIPSKTDLRALASRKTFTKLADGTEVAMEKIVYPHGTTYVVLEKGSDTASVVLTNGKKVEKVMEIAIPTD